MQSFDICYLLLSLLIGYAYVGYPLLLRILAALFRRDHIVDNNYRPTVSLIISAFNEAAVMRKKLDNSLELNYPDEKLSIVVVSDGSTDETDEIVRDFSEQEIRLLRPAARQGKTAGLNMALKEVSSEIVVFSDANALYDQEAIGNLVRHFADPTVGYVVGHARYLDGDKTAAGKSESGYWDFEVRLKHWESDFSSVVGGDGAIYAIRAELWEPLQETDINDFVNPLQIVAKGFRGIFDPHAWCTELPAGDFNKEFERKKRIANRSFNGLLRVSECLNPFKVGRFALLLFSHKLLRWFSGFLFLAHWLMTMIGLAFWGAFQPAYFMILLLYYLLFLLAMLGGYQEKCGDSQQPLFYYPYYLFLMNLSATLGVLLRLRGEVIYKWQTVREDLPARTEKLPESVLVIFSLVSLVVLIVPTLLHVQASALPAYALLGSLFYAYLGYPSVLAVVAALHSVSGQHKDDYCPPLTLLIVAYNEASVIEDKLKNSLELDYPADKLRILVASDGSTDGTNSILEEYVSKGVEICLLPKNRGKISALNEAMKSIETDLVVLSDANVMYAPTALRSLASHFVDSRVGAVSGRVILVNDDISYKDAENSYYGFEHFIQFKEGATGAVIGADGAMYAIRRNLFSPPPADTILDDFVISMQIACQGYWLLHDNNAVGYERNLQEIENEYQRKSRIIAGGIQTLVRGRGVPGLAMPLLLFKFVSHKLLRWCSGLLFFALIVILALQQCLGNNDLFLSLFLLLAVISAGGAGAAHFIPRLRGLPIISIVYYQFMLLFASLFGCWRGIRGRQLVTWKLPIR